MRLTKRHVVVAVAAVTLVTGTAIGYTRIPAVRVARHLARGDAAFGTGQYRAAVLEYRNVLEANPNQERALRQIGLAHYHVGEFGQALRYLPGALKRDPNDLEVRLTLARLYLLGRRPDLARASATEVLERDPDNFEALVLLAGSAQTPAEREEAFRRFDAHRATFGNRAQFHLALAGLYLAARDTTAAEGALKAAVAAEPESVEAHAALGDFFVMKRDAKEAENQYRTAADLSPVDSLPRLGLADFFLLVGRTEDAKNVLREVTEKAPDYLAAWRRLAEIAFKERRYDDCLKSLEVVFARNPSDFGGLLLRGRTRLAQSKTGAAIEDFQAVLKLEPRFAPAHYALAQAYVASRQLQYARSELREATNLQPTFTEAVLQLAELDIQGRAFPAAIEAMQKLTERVPNDPRGWRVLAVATLANGEARRSLAAARKVVELTPKDPRGPFLAGRALRALNQPVEARAAFEASLELAPGFPDPLVQLVGMSVAEKKLDAAVERVNRELKRAPDSARVYAVLGAVQTQRGDLAAAEAAYRAAIEREPALMAAHLALAQVLAGANRLDDARAVLDKAKALDPSNTSVLMLIGAINERRGDVAGARQTYERVLALEPRSPQAANNLAWIYSEHGGDKEKALELAQTAKQLRPDDARISDTLGWILYKRGVYQRARALLQESVTRMPDNPEIQYHFGMASLKAGDRAGAAVALRRAVASPSPFPGKDEARKALSELN